MMKAARRLLRWPIGIFEGYLHFVLLLFLIGPLKYNVVNPLKLCSFLLAAHLCLYMGYRMALRRPGAFCAWRVPIPLLTYLAIGSTLVVATVNYATFVPSVRDIPEAVLRGVTDLRSAYLDKFDSIHQSTGTIRWTMWFYPLAVLMIPFAIASWRFLSPALKVCVVCAKLFELGTWLALGTTKGIAETFVLLPWLIACSHPQVILRSMSLKTKMIGGFFVVSCLCCVLLFFVSSKTVDRQKYFTSRVATSRYSCLDYLSPRGEYAIMLFTDYMVQGYHGLDLSLSQPFVWAYGAGHSPYFLSGVILNFTGFDVGARSYPARVAQVEDWDERAHWYSIYPWIASDLTFPGCLGFVFCLGFVYALSWKDWLETRNLLAWGVFYQLSLVLLYFPLNNQVLGSTSGAIAFITCFLLWLLTRRKGFVLMGTYPRNSAMRP
jgi:hypothetical protein